jgi:hypothetical protein
MSPSHDVSRRVSYHVEREQERINQRFLKVITTCKLPQVPPKSADVRDGE